MKKCTNVFKMFFAALATIVCLSPIFFAQNYLVKATVNLEKPAYTGPDFYDKDVGNLFIGNQEVMAPAKYYQLTENWMSAGHNTPYNLHGSNSVKFHWYKKALIKPAWDNVDSNSSDALSGTVGEGVSTIGASAVLGYVTVNGTRYYIDGDTGDYCKQYVEHVQLLPKENFEQPKLMKVTNKSSLYDSGFVNTKFDNSGTVALMMGYGSETNTYLHKGQVVMIPSHHDPVEIFGTKYVPVIFTNLFGNTGTDLMKYSDYQKNLASGEGKTMQYQHHTVYQKNNHVYAKTASEKSFKTAVKFINSKLKKNKARFEKEIKADIKHNAEARFPNIKY